MGPRTQVQPQEYADQAAEAIRALNHATIGNGGYVWASDVDAVIGNLSTMVYGMNQALAQMQRWLFAQQDAGRIGHDENADTADAVEALATALLRTAARVEALDEGLADMRRVSTHLTTITPTPDREN